MQPARNGVSGGSGKRRKRIGGLPSERKLLLRLCLALEAQTLALTRYAESNEALVQAMAEEGDDDGPTSPSLGYVGSTPPTLHL